MTADTAACPGGSTNLFSTPDEWNGACFTQVPAYSGDSFTVAAAGLLATGGTCTPSNVTASDVQGAKTIAQACSNTNNPPIPGGQCLNHEICAFDKVDGFVVCLVDQSGDVSCPAGWPDKHLYYDDSTLCSCSCGAATGESCTTTVTVYEDTACQNPLGAASVSADQPAACVNVTPGSTFGSLSATPPAFKSGTCAPKLTTAPPWTLCCLP